MRRTYGFSAVTGGTAGCMDEVNGSALNDGDRGIVLVGGVFSAYTLDAASGAAVNGTTVVAPTVNAGDKRWIRTTFAGTSADDHDHSGTYVEAETDPVVGAINGLVKADGTGSISAAIAGTDYAAAFAVQAEKTFFAGPATGADAAPTFRTVAATDIPTLNQNTTGTAANVTGTVALANGGTGQTTAQAAIDALTAVAGATAEHVLTKDTVSGNAVFKAAPAGSGDVVGPATNTDNNVPQWSGEDSKTLKDGFAVGTAANNLLQLDGTAKLPAVDGSNLTNLPSGFADPMTTRGDMIYRASGGTSRLGIGAVGQVVTSDGTDVGWADQTGGGITVAQVKKYAIIFG